MNHATMPRFLRPTVSVILPTYNRAAYLERCIDSVLAQTFTDWELLVVDDGSSDATFPLVDAYVQRLSQVRYLKHNNRKLALTKNAGIQASFGDYITFVDSDDMLRPEHLYTRIEYMRTHPDIDLIEGGFEIFEDIYVADYFNPGQKVHIRECVLGPTFFGKRHVFVALQGFQEIAYGEDTDFWARAEQTFTVRKLHEPLTYVYTRAEESITKQFS